MKWMINGITVVTEQGSININGKTFKTPPDISEAKLMYLVEFIAIEMSSAVKTRAVDSLVDNLREHLNKVLIN